MQKVRGIFSGFSASKILGDKKWRCEKIGPLGWLESFVKAMAIGVAVASISIFDSAARDYFAEKIVQIFFFGLIATVMLGFIIHRIVDKEIFSLVFMCCLCASHWWMFVLLFKSVDPSAFIFTFCFLMIMAEYIKIMFLVVMKDFEVIWFPKPVLYAISAVFIIFYLLILVLQIVIYFVSFDT
eukprot:TRINITY_DN7531_c0_g1_i2.p1 TRINITY_DN7531_c0_g1~~TRINITY_DN7531_c0_g1_i2.p1  ORF type:complete len:183 (-),score=9.09 TRINITY_DN7531_c0_g1_i2:50-598(-)